MKKNYLTLILLGAGLLMGGLSWLNKNKISTQETSLDQVATTDSTAGKKVGETESSYQDYSAEAFEANASQRRVLFFYAPWCPTCRPVNQELEQKVGQLPADVVVFRTDYDSSTQLKQKYGVTYQHTFVLVDESGEKLKIWNGGGLNELIKNLE